MFHRLVELIPDIKVLLDKPRVYPQPGDSFFAQRQIAVFHTPEMSFNEAGRLNAWRLINKGDNILVIAIPDDERMLVFSNEKLGWVVYRSLDFY